MKPPERRELVTAAQARNEQVALQEAKAEALRHERARDFSLGANEMVRLAEYRAVGVEPPVVAGVPTRSTLALLLSLGWTVAVVDGIRELIAPAPPDARPRKDREHYDGNS